MNHNANIVRADGGPKGEYRRRDPLRARPVPENGLPCRIVYV